MESDQPATPDFEKVLQDHRALLQLLEKIGQVLSAGSGSTEEVVQMLGQLGDRLVKHFALEEEGGYFAEALAGAPQLISRANELLHQHPRMSAEARKLIELSDKVSDAQQWWKATRTRFEAFRSELLKHEQLENSLLQEAYQRDLGAQD